MPEKQYFTLAEARQYVGLSDSYFRLLVAHGQVPVIRLGRAVRFRRSALDAFMASRETGGTAAAAQAA